MRRATVAGAVVEAVVAAAASPARAAPRHEIQIQTSVSPGPHLFADTITTELDVLVDPKRVDPRSVHVDSTFDPYAVTSQTRASTNAAGVTELRFRTSLACLDTACVPAGSEEKVTFPRATVRFGRRGIGAVTLSVGWPAFRLVARAPKSSISQAALAFGIGGGQFDPNRIFHTPTFPPPPSYRFDPKTLGLILVGVAALALAAALVASLPLVAVARAQVRARAARSSHTPLEVAIESVRASATNRPGTPEHREALALLARELAGVGLSDLVRPATRLAWSAADPTRDESLELTQRVSERVNGTGE